MDIKPGQLRIWHIPQVPMTAFRRQVKDLEQARFLLKMLAEYDWFQLEHNVKSDYSSASGLDVWEKIDGVWDWYTWYNEDGDDFDEWLEQQEERENE